MQVLTDDSLKLKNFAELYPDEWAAVNRDMYKAFSEGNKDALYQFINGIKNK